MKKYLGEIQYKKLIFGHDRLPLNQELVVEAKESDFLDFLKKHPFGKKCQGINIDGTEEKFFLVYVADCFDPPLCIVRAEDMKQAEELFADETTYAHISEEDLKDYYLGDCEGKDESLQYNSKGVPYDNEQIQVHLVKLMGIET